GSVVGTLLTASTDFRAFAYPPASLILLGKEQAGLSAELAAACDVTVKIPMRGRADSLNLAVAAAVVIYAATGD
ncbi:MAG TPA: TrmH family RNA methyltransferase, partial [Caulobacteraceae bacterium]|nr:TrmH family RNA methyltransferase [Caulobacteraceae bacterium]